MIKPHLQSLQEQQIEEFVQLCAESNQVNNPVITQGTLKMDKFSQHTRMFAQQCFSAAKIVNESLSSNVIFNTFLRMDGVMVFGYFNCQLHCFLERGLKRVLKQVPTSPLNQYKKGTAVIGLRAFTHRDHFRRGIFKWSIIQQSKHLVQNGYTWQFIGITNPLSFEAFKKFGAEVISTTKYGNDNFYIARRDLRIAANMNAIIKQKE